MATKKQAWPERARRGYIAGTGFDLIDKSTVLALLQQRPATAGFDYVVTPNVDHVVRSAKHGLSELYGGACLSVCDSRILQKLGGLVDVRVPEVIPGSDLTQDLFDKVLRKDEPVTIIGASDQQIAALKSRYQLRQVCHYNPPMGFIHKPEEVAKAVEYVLAHPSRFVFLAVGSPQQEKLAIAIRSTGQAKGLGMCIGASILFLTGGEKRAPQWVQRISMEWAFRLLSNPKRLWRRYLVDDPAIFWMVIKQKLGH